MSGSYDSAVIGDRFQLQRAPTLLTRTASVAPIGFTRLRSERGRIRAKDVPAETAFSFHVALQPADVDLWIDGRHQLTASVAAGATFMFDLSSNPVSEIHTPFDVLRFYISQASLDELAADRGARRISAFAPSRQGVPDPVMHGLSAALLDQVERADTRSSLFIDHIGLAFHAHVTETYGEAGPIARATTGLLSPWQLRRAVEVLTARLDGDPTVAELARECGLSAGYFARAFRRTTGLAPHQWLTQKRVQRARELLLGGRLALADIAIACGFVDQSHFTRVFTRIERQSPGRWRRLNGSPPR